MFLEYWEFILPIITLLSCSVLWFFKGREKFDEKNIIAFYDIPQQMSPIEAGFLLDNDVDNNEIAAQIIYCINRGWLSLDYGVDKSDRTIKINKNIKELPDDNINKKLINSLFQGRSSLPISKLKEKNREDMNISYFDFKNLVSKNLFEKGFYKQDPRFIKSLYDKIGWAVIFIGIGIYTIGNMASFVFINPSAVIISGLIVVLFSNFMSAKTKKGMKLKNGILGFKKYLEVAEKDRINFHSKPEKKPNSFSRLLPYAMVFQQEKEWSKVVDQKTDEERFLDEFLSE